MSACPSVCLVFFPHPCRFLRCFDSFRFVRPPTFRVFVGALVFDATLMANCAAERSVERSAERSVERSAERAVVAAAAAAAPAAYCQLLGRLHGQGVGYSGGWLYRDGDGGSHRSQRPRPQGHAAALSPDRQQRACKVRYRVQQQQGAAAQGAAAQGAAAQGAAAQGAAAHGAAVQVQSSDNSSSSTGDSVSGCLQYSVQYGVQRVQRQGTAVVNTRVRLEEKVRHSSGGYTVKDASASKEPSGYGTACTTMQSGTVHSARHWPAVHVTVAQCGARAAHSGAGYSTVRARLTTEYTGQSAHGGTGQPRSGSCAARGAWQATLYRVLYRAVKSPQQCKVHRLAVTAAVQGERTGRATRQKTAPKRSQPRAGQRETCLADRTCVFCFSRSLVRGRRDARSLKAGASFSRRLGFLCRGGKPRGERHLVASELVCCVSVCVFSGGGGGGAIC